MHLGAYWARTIPRTTRAAVADSRRRANTAFARGSTASSRCPPTSASLACRVAAAARPQAASHRSNRPRARPSGERAAVRRAPPIRDSDAALRRTAFRTRAADLPAPDPPVNTTSASRGMSTSTLRRLCSRAPRTRTKPSRISRVASPRLFSVIRFPSDWRSPSLCRVDEASFVPLRAVRDRSSRDAAAAKLVFHLWSTPWPSK